MNYKLNQLRETLAKKDIAVIYVSDSDTVCYLLGVKASNVHLFLLNDRAILVTDGRYIVSLSSDLKGCEIEVLDIKNLDGNVFNVLKSDVYSVLGIEFSKNSYAEVLDIKKDLGTIELINIDEDISELRIIKNNDELAIISEGIAIHEDIFSSLVPQITEGMSELQVKKLFDIAVMEVSGSMTSFETIVAFGENAALPHHHSSHRILKAGDAVLIDSGIIHKGYCTDMTRTMFCKEISPLLEADYCHVMKAVELGELSAVEGRFTSEAHNAVVEYFTANKVNEYYLHSLGHGVGIDIHEAPGLGKKEEYRFKEGMVFTIEPGLYRENIGGIRIENMYFISAQGVTKFNKSEYNLKII